MSTMVQRRQNFIRYCRDLTGKKEISMKEVASIAARMGWRIPTPPDPLDLLAKQFSEAAGEETRQDKKTKRTYKANLAITQGSPDGTQTALWFDIDQDAPRHRMMKGLTQYREQMVGEAVIGTNTADHWNRLHPNQPPLPFETDLTLDVQIRLNAPDDDEKAG